MNERMNEWMHVFMYMRKVLILTLEPASREWPPSGSSREEIGSGPKSWCDTDLWFRRSTGDPPPRTACARARWLTLRRNDQASLIAQRLIKTLHLLPSRMEEKRCNRSTCKLFMQMTSVLKETHDSHQMDSLTKDCLVQIHNLYWNFSIY